VVVVPFELVPFELVKIKFVPFFEYALYNWDRLQDNASMYKGPTDVVKQVIQKEGILGLYAGMESTF
jgi:solute carrier family 25 2-oxodicarboxylate transporter 21